MVECFLDDGAVADIDFSGFGVDIGEGMLHPISIISIGEVVTGVGSSGLLTVEGGLDGLLGVDQEVIEFEGFDEVSVPDESSVLGLDVVDLSVDVVHDIDSLLEGLSDSVDGGVLLHGGLHLQSDLSSGDVSVGVPELVEHVEGLLSGVLWEVWVLGTWLEFFLDGLGGGSSEDDDIEQAVGTESVGSVDGGAGGLSGGEETGDDDVLAVSVVENLSLVVGWDTTHIVVNGWDDWGWLLGDVNSGEDLGGFGDTGESEGENFGWEMVQVEVDVVLVWPAPTSLEDLHTHGSGDDVTGGEVLDGGGVTLHESLSERVSQDTTLSSATLREETSGSVDSRWVELDELGVLAGESSTTQHTITVSRAGVRGGAGEVGASPSSRGDDGVVGSDSVDSSVSDGHADDSSAGSLLVHDQVENEVLDEEVAVVPERSPEKCVEHGVSGSVGGGGASVGLDDLLSLDLESLSEIQGLTSEGSLVDSASSNDLIFRASSGEWHSVALQLEDGLWGLLAHIMNSVLVTQKIGSLHGIVGVPSPVIRSHISEGSVDTSLGGNCV